MKRALKREQLVETAAELFNRFGYHAAGIDHVIAEAGIAKTTLYRHFKSKENLIIAVLRRMDERFREDMRNAADRSARDPAQKLLATFDFLEDWFEDSSFYGCPFMSAASEFGERPSLVFQEAATHKRLVMAYFEELTRAAHLDDPRRIAKEISLLHEGAIAMAHITGDPGAARTAKAIATTIVDNAAGHADEQAGTRDRKRKAKK